MAETAARLQTHNQEMVKCLDQLRTMQTALEEKIAVQEKKRDALNEEMEKLQRSLEDLETSIASDTKMLNDCSKKLTETENGYTKLADTMQLLLMAAKENGITVSTTASGSSSSVPQDRNKNASS
uniref:Uncharacterized protein n=1 Tax=Anopheles epiroticus TaxID=199890 RepID=A0A182PE17_9DIPT